MNPFLRPFTSAAVLVLSISSAFAEDAITLKQQWQAGKRYSQTMKMDQSSKMSFGDVPMDQKMTMTAVTTMTVTRKPDKRKQLALKYESMLIDTETGGQKMVIDSSKPAPGNPLGTMVGKEIRAILDENDKVVDFENLEEITGGAAANPLTSGLMGKDSLSRLINQSGLQTLPGKPVKSGESWPFEIEMPMPQIGKMAIKGTYTYKGTSPRNGVPCAEILMDATINADMSSPGAAGAKEANPLAQMGMKIEGGTMKGTIWFDNALGTARATEVAQEMTMVMNNPLKAGESIKIPVKQLIKVDLTKVEEVK
ncbi:MAG: DUF6263 family protein [Verrucomicrobiota bacterium]